MKIQEFNDVNSNYKIFISRIQWCIFNSLPVVLSPSLSASPQSKFCYVLVILLRAFISLGFNWLICNFPLISLFLLCYNCSYWLICHFPSSSLKSLFSSFLNELVVQYYFHSDSNTWGWMELEDFVMNVALASNALPSIGWDSF